MKLRRFNDAGIAAFSAFLDRLEVEPNLPLPRSLLEDATFTQVVQGGVDISPTVFGSRLEAARFLHDLLASAGLTEIENDKGLWAWLALLFFDEICPVRSGVRSPGERARYIPEALNFQRYYRHLLAGPYRIYKAHRDKPDRALALLCQPLDKPGDIVEQLASRQELVTNKSVMAAASALYIDPSTRQPKRGSQTKAAGAVRRLAVVLNQFDVTWDLYSTHIGELLGILPSEFKRFLPGEDAVKSH